MFKGSYQHSIDDKGRISIPSRYRELILERSKGKEEVTITRIENCIEVYTLLDWEKIEKKFQEVPLMDEDIQTFTRIFFMRARDCKLDSQGRILLPSTMRDGCEMGRQALIIGVMNKIEIWPVNKWEDTEKNFGSKFNEIRKKLVSFGI